MKRTQDCCYGTFPRTFCHLILPLTHTNKCSKDLHEKVDKIHQNVRNRYWLARQGFRWAEHGHFQHINKKIESRNRNVLSRHTRTQQNSCWISNAISYNKCRLNGVYIYIQKIAVSAQQFTSRSSIPLIIQYNHNSNERAIYAALNTRATFCAANSIKSPLHYELLHSIITINS